MQIPSLRAVRRIALVAAAVVATLTLGVHPGAANICALDTVPAATLLFPYVVLDYNHPETGVTTILSLTNTAPQAQIVHVTIWTDLSAAILDFNVILTGYDVQTIDLREVFMSGQLPVTVQQPHTSMEGVDQRGPMRSASLLALPESTEALDDRCPTTSQAYPGLYVFPMPPALLELFRDWFSASQSLIPDGACCSYPWWAVDRADAPTAFYVTADVVTTCGKTFVDESGYWSSAAGGQPRYDNVLIGRVTWIGPGGATSAAAVHLEADRNLGAVTPRLDDGRATSFYARYSAGGHDGREPLPTAWGLRYESDDNGFHDSRIVAWKGSTRFRWPPDLEVFGDRYHPTSLSVSNDAAYTVWVWDEEENVVAFDPWFPPSVDYNMLPFTIQSVAVDQFPVVDESGWMLFAWPPSNDPTEWGEVEPDAYQTWMGVMQDYGTASVFTPGTVMANGNCFPDQVTPNLGVNYDYVDEHGYRTGTGAPSIARSVRAR